MCSLLPSDFTSLCPNLQLQSGIGRLILKEEMKARSSSYADPWTPPRSSTSSREALHTGYEMSLNGCKHCPWRLTEAFVPTPSMNLQYSLTPGLECRLGEGLYASLNKTMLCPEPLLLLLWII